MKSGPNVESSPRNCEQEQIHKYFFGRAQFSQSLPLELCEGKMYLGSLFYNPQFGMTWAYIITLFMSQPIRGGALSYNNGAYIRGVLCDAHRGPVCFDRPVHAAK